MTRKKKKPSHEKRHQFTDDTGWTHVVKGPKGGINAHRSTAFLRQERTEASSTIQTSTEKFEKYYKPHWRDSSCYARLAQIFEQDILSAADIKITQCVCLGLGSLTGGSSSDSSSWEFAALISILEILGAKHPIKPEFIIFQDPIFNALDVTSLGNRGYTVAEHPEAFSLVTDTTFLFAPHLECGYLAKALESASPAICVGSDLTGYVDGMLRAHAEEARAGSVEVFQRYRDVTFSRPMPEFERSDWCFALQIYWLKAEVSTPDEQLKEEELVSALANQQLRATR